MVVQVSSGSSPDLSTHVQPLLVMSSGGGLLPSYFLELSKDTPFLGQLVHKLIAAAESNQPMIYLLHLSRVPLTWYKSSLLVHLVPKLMILNGWSALRNAYTIENKSSTAHGNPGQFFSRSSEYRISEIDTFFWCGVATQEFWATSWLLIIDHDIESIWWLLTQGLEVAS